MRLASGIALLGQRDPFPGTSFGADFLSRVYKVGNTVVKGTPLGIPGMTFTRASAGYAETIDGRLTAFASGDPRQTDKGLLIEEARTNLLLRSQEFDNASWTKTRSTVSANAVAAPDGTLTADALVEDTANNTHFAVSAAVSMSSGTIYTTSVYAKANGRNVSISLPSAVFGTNVRWTFDLSAVSVTQNVAGTADSATITALANGWYRCTVTATATATSSASVAIYLISGSTVSYTGDGTSGTYLWGAQLEAGAFATSYIPTAGSSATRPADVASVSGLTLTTPLTMVIEYQRVSEYGVVQAVAEIDDGSQNNCLLSYVSAGDKSNGFVAVAGVTQADIGYSVNADLGVTIKQAVRFAANDVQLANNGALGSADTSATMPTGLNALQLGRRAAGNGLGGYIRRLAIYPYAANDAQLQAMTA